MTSPDRGADPADAALQFDAAESTAAATPQGIACGNCGKTLTGIYHLLNQTILCSTCRQRLEREWKGGSGTGRLSKALLYGLGGAALGSAIYYAVLAMTGLEIGLIAILVGFLVGKAVQKGSGGRGGATYQAMAILLTYFAIVSTYIPLIVKEFRENPGLQAAADSSTAGAGLAAEDSLATTAATADSSGADVAASQVSFGQFLLAVGAMLALAAVLPFLAGIGNIIGLLIIGFALYEAWKLNKRPILAFTGPFQVGAAAPRPA